MNDANPKPCPFCGNKNALVKQCGGSLWMVCQTCGATGPEGDSIDDAVNGWNMRLEPIAVKQSWWRMAHE